MADKPTDDALLARVDERTKRIDERCDHIETWIKGLSDKLDTKHVTRAEFQPVKYVVYGLVGLILTSVMGAFLTLVFKVQG